MISQTAKPCILIVEDVTNDIDILNHILKDHYTLYIAKTGKAALKMAVELVPDMILLDIVLPDMTGFAVLQKLKEMNETKNIHVIIITGVHNVQYEEKGLLLGAVDYITKPFHNAVMMARLRTHIQILQHIRTIEQLGLLDSLTGLPNRRSFDRRIALEWARACREQTPLGLLMIDIDYFKLYNDTYGHLEGDKVLREIANVLNGTLKRPADMAARYGGEEFAVLLPNTNLVGSKLIAEKIRSQVEATNIPFRRSCENWNCENWYCEKREFKFQNDDDNQNDESQKDHCVTLCVGVSVMLPDRNRAYEDLILEADQFLYKAKSSGRNCICFKEDES